MPAHFPSFCFFSPFFFHARTYGGGEGKCVGERFLRYDDKVFRRFLVPNSSYSGVAFSLFVYIVIDKKDVI